MKYNRLYHPAFAWGSWIVLVCFIILGIAYFTNLIPLELQPMFILLLVSFGIGGGVIATVGLLKSFDRGSYPLLLAVFLIPAVLFVIYYLMTR